MSTDGNIVPRLDIFGLAYSIAGLALVMPITFGFREYLRFLDYMQFMYLWGVIIMTTQISFSDFLDESFLIFMPNFLTFCTPGDFVCTAGGHLSFAICLVGAIIILAIIFRLEKLRRPTLNFQPVYSFLKGLVRWVYFPLAYFSIFYLIYTLRLPEINIPILISSAVVLAIIIIFPIGQLIMYKLIQAPQDLKIWIKWIQFANYLRLLSVALLMAFYVNYINHIPLYLVFPVFVAYDALYLWKGDFDFVVFGRLIHVLLEAIIIAIYCLVIWGSTYVVQYDLDLFLLSGIILIELIYYLAKSIKAIRNRKDAGQTNPIQEHSQSHLNPPIQHNNDLPNNNLNHRKSFQANELDSPNHSRKYVADLHDSRESLDRRNGQNSQVRGGYQKPGRRRK